MSFRVLHNITKRLDIKEKEKIRHAEKFFNDSVKIEFKTQFSNNKIVDLIGEIIREGQ